MHSRQGEGQRWPTALAFSLRSGRIGPCRGPASAFRAPAKLLDLDIDEVGTLYASAAIPGKGGELAAVYRIAPRGQVSLVTNSLRDHPLLPAALKSAGGGLRLDSMSFALVQDR